ncbi:MAG: hypothetical protein JSR21_05965 [Proteobacteria bacterium]|nr:hypothetical protein [Pseudomonadota bacterium]
MQRILAFRIVLVCLGATVALTAYVAAIYLMDLAELRQRALAGMAASVVEELAAGRNPALLPPFRDYPSAYGVRVFNRRSVENRKLVAEVNPHLLPPLTAAGGTESDYDITEGLAVRPLGADDGAADSWIYTDHFDVKGNSYWVQTVMAGDPARLWWGIMEKEVRDHVMVPVLFLMPGLMLAILLTIRRSLEPLTRISRRAAGLTRAIESGNTPSPLPVAGLPAEVRDLVVAINGMSASLDQLFQRQKQFASDVAHELRTPLAVMLLETARLAPSPERESIADEVQGLIRMVNQLLRLAQAEDAMLRERAPLDIVPAVRRVCEDLADRAMARSQTIEFDAPDGPVVVFGHPTLIEIAVTNVLDNAIRLSPRGSVVSVSIDTAGTVTVDDSGPGVPDADKTRIFERYWRGDTRRGGSGIGLALVSRIVRLHDGAARVEDRPGGTGARFVLRFGPPPDRPADTRAARLRRLRVPASLH